MNYKTLERYTGITKENYLEIKRGGDCPYSLDLLRQFVCHVVGIKAENREKEAEDFLNKIKW